MIIEKCDWQYINRLLEAAATVQDLSRDPNGFIIYVDHSYNLNLAAKIQHIIETI